MTNQDESRAAFEAHVRTLQDNPPFDQMTEDRASGEYASWSMERDWRMWQAAWSRAPSAEAKDAERSGTVADIADHELLRRAISNLAAKARRQPAWARISDVFALGSTYSAQLCTRFGRDPDTGAAIAQQGAAAAQEVGRG